MQDRVATSAEARVETVREAIDAFNRRDLDALRQIGIADDFVYDWSRGLGPNRGVYRGADGFEEFAELVAGCGFLATGETVAPRS